MRMKISNFRLTNQPRYFDTAIMKEEYAPIPPKPMVDHPQGRELRSKGVGPVIPTVDYAKHESFLPFGIRKVPWSQAGLLKDRGKAAQYELLFGPDKASGEWSPVEELPRFDSIPLDYSGLISNKLNLPKVLRGYLFWHLIDCLEVAMSSEHGVIASLYKPENEEAAYLRQQVILPIFGSVKGFYQFMSKFTGDVEHALPLIPSVFYPPMSIYDIIDLFAKEGDKDGETLAKFAGFLLPLGKDVLRHLDSVRSTVKSVQCGWL